MVADDIYDLHEYDDIMEDILNGVEGDSFDAQGLDQALKELNLNHLDRGSDAWNKLNTFLGPGYMDDASDSERWVVLNRCIFSHFNSIVTVDDLGFNGTGEGDAENVENPGQNDWEHISADTLSQLPPSPNRVLKSPQQDGRRLSEGEQADDQMSPPPGSPKPLPFAGGANGIGVDEVEVRVLCFFKASADLYSSSCMEVGNSYVPFIPLTSPYRVIVDVTIHELLIY